MVNQFCVPYGISIGAVAITALSLYRACNVDIREFVSHLENRDTGIITFPVSSVTLSLPSGFLGQAPCCEKSAEKRDAVRGILVTLIYVV